MDTSWQCRFMCSIRGSPESTQNHAYYLLDYTEQMHIYIYMCTQIYNHTQICIYIHMHWYPYRYTLGVADKFMACGKILGRWIPFQAHFRKCPAHSYSTDNGDEYAYRHQVLPSKNDHPPLPSTATGTAHTNTAFILSVLQEAQRLLYLVSRFSEASTYWLAACRARYTDLGSKL